MKKIIIIAATLIIVALIALFIRFVGGMSAGNSIVKQYFYSGGVEEFLNHAQTFSAQDSNVISKRTDTTGNARNGYAYYMDIELKNNGHDFLYSIACESNNNSPKSGTLIKLVMAYDKINNIGGYRKEAKGIDPLVNIFDIDFLKPLMNSQNIKVTPL
jgi:hypothetical protein